MVATIHILEPLSAVSHPSARAAEDLGYDDFCTILESGDYDAFIQVGDFMILHLPRAALICKDGNCVTLTTVGTNMRAIFDASHAALEAGANAEGPARPLPKAA